MKKMNVANWFEIYVEDLDRAEKFYEAVLNVKMQKLPTPDGDHLMSAFPMEDGAEGASGALVMQAQMKPGVGGTMVYFGCEDCINEQTRAVEAGGKLVQAKMPIGEYGFIAICQDTEGNHFGLHSRV